MVKGFLGILGQQLHRLRAIPVPVFLHYPRPLPIRGVCGTCQADFRNSLALGVSRNQRIQPRIQTLDRQVPKTGSFRKCDPDFSTGKLGLDAVEFVQLAVTISALPNCTALPAAASPWPTSTMSFGQYRGGAPCGWPDKNRNDNALLRSL